MKNITVANTTDSPLFIMGMMVAPGESRDFPEDLVPQNLRPKVHEPVTVITVDIDSLLTEGEAAIIAALPMISSEQLHQLGEAELQSGSVRAKLMESITATLVERGDASKPKTLEQAIESAAKSSLPGGEFYQRSAYVISGISGHYKVDPAEVERMLKEAVAKVEAAAASTGDALSELAAKGVKEIAAAIPSLIDADLGKLEKLEQAKEAPRKTVLEAIGAETLKRAGAGS